ncbi:MAG: multicopper oxidase domain-containing protein [Methylococcales bacterium]
MNNHRLQTIGIPLSLVIAALLNPAQAAVNIQCPGDINDGVMNAVPAAGPNYDPKVKCKHLGAGDGFITMADSSEMYILGFSDLTGVSQDKAAHHGLLAATSTAPTIELNEGDKFYLSLTNVGMLKRPDLFDPHSVHFHGFPNAASVFDGEPEASATIGMGSTLTYFYDIKEPGTYMYHCHVEASEHMQMGMLGNLFVHPAQDGTAFGGFNKFAYNDTDGSTGYDVEVPIQIGSFDSVFHAEHIAIQPLPFADMKDDYAVLNGRGYPDSADNVNAPAVPAEVAALHNDPGDGNPNDDIATTQPLSSKITATAGQRVLLRISNLNVTRNYTLAAMGLTMKVVGRDARILRAMDVNDPLQSLTATGTDLYYETNSVTLGSGETADVLIDTTGVAPGTYFIYTTNLNYLSNGPEDFGGMMTELVIS